MSKPAIHFVDVEDIDFYYKNPIPLPEKGDYVIKAATGEVYRVEDIYYPPKRNGPNAAIEYCGTIDDLHHVVRGYHEEKVVKDLKQSLADLRAAITRLFRAVFMPRLK